MRLSRSLLHHTLSRAYSSHTVFPMANYYANMKSHPTTQSPPYNRIPCQTSISPSDHFPNIPSDHLQDSTPQSHIHVSNTPSRRQLITSRASPSLAMPHDRLPKLPCPYPHLILLNPGPEQQFKLNSLPLSTILLVGRRYRSVSLSATGTCLSSSLLESSPMKLHLLHRSLQQRSVLPPRPVFNLRL